LESLGNAGKKAEKSTSTIKNIKVPDTLQGIKNQTNLN
jgi:hypothetical protein